MSLMRPDELKKLLDRNEDEHVEFKEAKSSFDFDKLVAYSVALANERGGLLILGVTDKKPRSIVGSKAYLSDLAKIKEHLIFQVGLRIDVDEVQCPEGRVLVFKVPSRPIGTPLNVNGAYLMRAGEALTAMSADMLKRIFDEAGPDFSAETCAVAVLDDLDSAAIEDFRSRWARKSGNESLARLPIPQLLADAELLVNDHLTYAALVLFGKREALAASSRALSSSSSTAPATPPVRPSRGLNSGRASSPSMTSSGRPSTSATRISTTRTASSSGTSRPSTRPPYASPSSMP